MKYKKFNSGSKRAENESEHTQDNKIQILGDIRYKNYNTEPSEPIQPRETRRLYNRSGVKGEMRRARV